MKQNGDLPAGSYANDAWVKGDYDPYDLSRVQVPGARPRPRARRCSPSATSETDGTNRVAAVPRRASVCARVGDDADWVLTPGKVNLMEQPFDYLELCGGFLSAAIGVFTQPVGINNSIKRAQTWPPATSRG